MAVVSRPPCVEPAARRMNTSAWRPKPRASFKSGFPNRSVFAFLEFLKRRPIPTGLGLPAQGFRTLGKRSFTPQLNSVLKDEEYRALQQALMFRPDQGAMIRGSGSLRKVRWDRSGIGRRGSIRVIYTGMRVMKHSTCSSPMERTSRTTSARALLKVAAETPDAVAEALSA